MKHVQSSCERLGHGPIVALLGPHAVNYGQFHRFALLAELPVAGWIHFFAPTWRKVLNCAKLTAPILWRIDIMRKLSSLFTAVLISASLAAIAGPTHKTAKSAKVADLWVCPMTGETVAKGHEAGTPVVVAGKRVHFCCGGCPSAFAKLSPADQKTKVAAAAKKVHTAKG